MTDTTKINLNELLETLRDPMKAENLDELRDILNEWAEAMANREFPEDEPQDYPCDVTSLPTFGEDITDTSGIYSWDDSRVLIAGPQITPDQTGWEINGR